MSNRKKLKAKRKGIKQAEQRRAEGRTPLYDDKRRYNGYQCSPRGGCGGIFLTVDLDRGTTPMFMPCLVTEGCEGLAASMMYPRTPPPKKLPLLVEWYEPAEDVVIKEPALVEHVRRGGLLRRPTADAPGWVKELLGPTYLRRGEPFHQLTLIPGGQDEEGEADSVRRAEVARVHPAGEGRRLAAADPGDSGSGNDGS